MEHSNAFIAQNIFDFVTAIREKFNLIFALLCVICPFFAETEVMIMLHSAGHLFKFEVLYVISFSGYRANLWK